jgi:hypothetical protein
VRLTELVDQLNQIDIEEWREPDIDPRCRRVSASRSLSLRMRFSKTADALFRKAVTAQAGGDIGVQTLYAERTHAMALYRAGRLAEGRDLRATDARGK